MPDVAPIKAAFYKGLQDKANPVVGQALNIHDWGPLDSAGLGNFNWYWNSAQIFTRATWDEFNNVIQYNPDGYFQTTDGTALTTSLFNIYNAIAYILTDADQTALNNANAKAQGIVNTVVNGYTTMFGAIPPANSATVNAKLSYITQQILSWGSAGLTLGTFRSSVNPMSLLPNIPFGASDLVSNFMAYLTQTAAAATIQNAVASQTRQVAQCALNLSPTPAAVAPGWMSAQDVSGMSSIVPYLTIAEPTDVIQNGLNGPQGFSVTLDVTIVDQNTVSVSVNGSGGARGSIGWFTLSGSASVQYNMSQFDSNVKKLQLTLTYSGVTKLTPQLSASAYQIGTGTGWWNPDVIKQAANASDGTSGLRFTTPQHHKFGKNGDFGVLKALVLSQLPTIKMVFYDASEHSFSTYFHEESHWSVGFLGISLASGGQSYTSSKYQYDSTAGTITVNMTPPPAIIPGTLATSAAYVIGASIDWPGAA